MLTTFASSLDPDQAPQNVGPDLDPNCLTLILFLKELLENVNFKKNSRQQKKHVLFPARKVLKPITYEGTQWLSGRVLDSRPRGCGFEPHWRHCIVVLEHDTFILA